MSGEGRRLIPRQRVGAPTALVASCACSAGCSITVIADDWFGLTVCVAGAVVFAFVTLLLALLPPDEEELCEVRARYDKKIARLEARKP